MSHPAAVQPQASDAGETSPQSANAAGSSRPGDACSVIDGKFILQWFSPRWFIFIMGTGALATMYQVLAGSPTGLLHSIAVGFLLIAAIAFPIVSVLKLWRLFAHLNCLLQEWSHSSLMQFYSAIPIAAAVVSTGLLRVGLPGLSEGAVGLATALWVVALVFGLGFVVLIPLRVILGSHAEPKRALGFWFLPPVGLFVLVFNGNFLAPMLGPAAAGAIFQLNTVVLGLALFLTAAVFTIFLFRSLFYDFPRSDIAPSYVIGLAPVGVSIIALNSYLPLFAQFAPDGLPSVELVGGLVRLLSVWLWGFGLWWLVVSGGLVLIKFLKGGIPVTLGYWAFIFPPAAYTIATLMLAGQLAVPVLTYVGYALAALVTVAWVVVSGMVLRSTVTRQIFVLPPSFQDLGASPQAKKAGS